MKVLSTFLLAMLSIFGGQAFAEESLLGAAYDGVVFQYHPPKDWSLRDVKGSKALVAFGHKADDFEPSLSVDEEAYSRTTQNYARENYEALKGLLKKVEIISETEFVTTSGIKGTRLIAINEQEKRLVRQNIFVLEGEPGKVYVLTSTVLAQAGPKSDALFEASAKSFELKKRCCE
jgi:hypothetical protein